MAFAPSHPPECPLSTHCGHSPPTGYTDEGEGALKNHQLNVAGLIIGFIVMALVLCGVAAWFTGNTILLLPGLALLPGWALP